MNKQTQDIVPCPPIRFPACIPLPLVMEYRPSFSTYSAARIPAMTSARSRVDLFTHGPAARRLRSGCFAPTVEAFENITLADYRLQMYGVLLYVLLEAYSSFTVVAIQSWYRWYLLISSTFHRSLYIPRLVHVIYFLLPLRACTEQSRRSVKCPSSSGS